MSGYVIDKEEDVGIDILSYEITRLDKFYKTMVIVGVILTLIGLMIK